MRFRVVAAWIALVLVPGIVSGQQTAGVIAGQVRDTTGGVLPGVTVEVASPALIERVRSVVTGDDGQYRIVELRPGEYSVTFTLGGFGKFVRDGVQLTSGFTATVNAELRVGEVSETITVTGGSPVVDLQNVTQQSVLSKTTVDALPSGGSYGAIGRLIPGVDAAGNGSGNDVGGSQGRDSNKLVIHGSSTNDFKLLIDGMPQGTFAAGNGGDNVGIPPTNGLAEEINLQYSALPAEVESGGPLMNMVPKTGGNTFHASFFGNVATSAMQAKQGIASGSDIDYITDANPSFGGPIKQDKVWFFVTYRDFRPYKFASIYYDANKTDWVFTPDTTKDAPVGAQPQKSVNSRFTWQATPRNRVNMGLEFGRLIQYNQLIAGQTTGLSAAEYTPNSTITNKPILQLGWTAPVNNRLLVDIGGQIFRARWWSTPQTDISVSPGATELATGVNFRSHQTLGIFGYGGADPYWHDFLRGAVSYTTGAHAIKVGVTVWHGGQTIIGDSQGFGPYFVRLLNGAPNGVIYRVDPLSSEFSFVKSAIFAQDQWTVRRLTVNGGLRIDTIDTGYPAQHEVATAYFPARDFAAGDVLRWRDISPRLGVAYDLFGNGKTAVKASFSRYVAAEAQVATTNANPANASGGTLQRTWNDALVCPTCVPGDFVPQGDPTNPVANGEIGPSPNARWGEPVFTTRYDPAWSQGGWGVRGYNWEQSVSMQQELRSNVSVNVGYFYRTFGNTTVTDNAATTAADYDSFCVTGPRDPKLPDGGGLRQCGLVDVKPASVSKLDNLVTLASNYGDIQQTYRGIDVGINLKLQKALVQGGLNTGRELYDFCSTVAQLPERLVSGSTKIPADQCHQVQPWVTQVKLLGTYELPWALSVAMAYQDSYNLQAPSNFLQGTVRMGIAANWLATNAQIAPELGRNLSAGANANASINVVTPGTLLGDRVRQLDVRFGRTFKAGRASIKAMFDLYNAFNANTILTTNQTYGTNGATWNDPVTQVPGRLAKVGVQIDY